MFLFETWQYFPQYFITYQCKSRKLFMVVMKVIIFFFIKNKNQDIITFTWKNTSYMLVQLFPLNESFDHMVSQKPIWQQKCRGGALIFNYYREGGCFLGHVNVMSNTTVTRNQPAYLVLISKVVLTSRLILAFMATLTKMYEFFHK